MGHLYKKNTTRFVDPQTGKRTTRTKCPDARREESRSPKWWGKWIDADGIERRESLAKDKSVARQMLAEREREAERGRAGISDPFAVHRKTPLVDHVAAFGRHLAAKGNTPRHVRDTLSKLSAALVEGCRFRLLDDLRPGSLAEYLADRREAGLGVATSNRYLVACKSFAKWLVRDRRRPDDVFAHLSALNERTDVRKERRALSDEEVGRLLTATEAGPRRGGLSGPDRAMLYRVALGTGARVSELASLTRASFDLDGPAPTVTIDAAYSSVGGRM